MCPRFQAPPDNVSLRLLHDAIDAVAMFLVLPNCKSCGEARRSRSAGGPQQVFFRGDDVTPDLIAKERSEDRIRSARDLDSRTHCAHRVHGVHGARIVA